jgi:hypothetical protein
VSELDVVFALGRADPENLAALARLLQKEVTAASPAFAARLNLRCLPSRVEVSSDGQTLEVEELGP